MTSLQLSKAPVATAQMLIRKPVTEVFEAFVDPRITTKFWFTKSTGRLEAGNEVTWSWEMYDVSTPVKVKEIEPNRRIVIEWGNAGEITTVEWRFIPHENDLTYVIITNSGFPENGDEAVQHALDSTGGFTTVIDGAKAWLEHGINLNLIADKFPKGLAEH